MTLRRARARATVGLIAWLALSPAVAAAQDSLAEAKKLYQSADYDAALGVLDRLKNAPADGPDPEMAQYRVFCLLALGRSNDAQQGIAAILRQNPQYRPSETETSPRIRAVFEDARRRLLPQIVKERYDAAKTTFEKQEFQSAADQFISLASLLEDPTLVGEDPRTDLRIVVSGFADLARAAAVTKTAAAVTKTQDAALPVPEVQPVPASGAADAAPLIYNAGTPGVVPPVAISRPLPPLPRADVVLVRREYIGALEIVVDQQGRVSDVTVRKGVHPQFDARLVSTVRTWKFHPATKDGQPVRYRSLFEVKLVP